MNRALTDFNDIDNGIVRFLSSDADTDVQEGDVVILHDDGEQEAMARIVAIEGRLVAARIDWDTFGPAGSIKPVSLQLLGYPHTTRLVVTGSVWHDLVTERPSERIEDAAERVCV